MTLQDTIFHVYPKRGYAESILNALPLVNQLAMVERWASRGMAHVDFLRESVATCAPIHTHTDPQVLQGVVACIVAIGGLAERKAA